MDNRQSQAKFLDSIFFAIVFGCTTGILSASLFPNLASRFLLLVILGGFAVVLLFLPLIWRLDFQNAQGSRASVVALFLFASLLGVWRMDISRPDESYLQEHVDTQVVLTGIISNEPTLKNGSQSFILELADQSILVSTSSAEKLAYGDEVSTRGTLEEPENFQTDQGMEFDYISYLYKDDILYRMSFAKVEIISQENGNWVISHLIDFKNVFVRSFHRILPSREADLLGGIVLGSKSSIDKDFRNDLVTTGTIHIIALSGYNVSIIATSLRSMLANISVLGPVMGNMLGALGILVFVAMTGLQSSAIRAGIMALITIFARSTGRMYDAFRALVFAGFLMILWNPKYLVYDVSFQLSFIATLGIIFLTPLLEQKFARVPKKILWILPLREALSVTLGAQIAVMPFILYKMGILSIIALPANILVLPAIPYAMALGALAGALGIFSSGLAYPVAWVTHILLRYVIEVITFFASVPYASVTIRNFPLIVCIVLYVFLFMIVYRSRKAYSEKKLSYEI